MHPLLAGFLITIFSTFFTIIAKIIIEFFFSVLEQGGKNILLFGSNVFCSVVLAIAFYQLYSLPSAPGSAVLDANVSLAVCCTISVWLSLFPCIFVSMIIDQILFCKRLKKYQLWQTLKSLKGEKHQVTDLLSFSVKKDLIKAELFADDKNLVIEMLPSCILISQKNKDESEKLLEKIYYSELTNEKYQFLLTVFEQIARKTQAIKKEKESLAKKIIENSAKENKIYDGLSEMLKKAEIEKTISDSPLTSEQKDSMRKIIATKEKVMESPSL